MNPKWPKVEQTPVHGSGREPQVEKRIKRGDGKSWDAMNTSLERIHPLDSKAFNKTRPQK